MPGGALKSFKREQHMRASFGRINLMLALALLVVMAGVSSAADHPTVTTPLPSAKDRKPAPNFVVTDANGKTITHPISYPVVVGDADFAELFQIDSLPVTSLIDRNGRIADWHVGMVVKSTWEDDIRRLLREKATKQHEWRPELSAPPSGLSRSLSWGFCCGASVDVAGDWVEARAAASGRAAQKVGHLRV
jgi:hypothetical protein